ncbi:MAG: adaptor protein MecA [Ruminococcaceae bacterium]|nr:adaptor protein MecA [Oscillospiraceae bacterium]
MTIEKLSDEKILISLCKEDMESLRLNTREMGFCDESSKRSLLRLLQVACREAGMSAVSKTVLMEALPVQSGCLFLLTFTEKKERRTYRVKKTKEGPCYVFSDAEKMLSAAEISYLKKIGSCDNALWAYSSKYYLIFKSPLIKGKLRDILAQYAERIPVTALINSRINEGGKLLCAGDALHTIGKKLCNKSKI